MPRPRGSPIGEKRSNLNLFGEWFYAICDTLSVNMMDIAERAELHQPSITRYTKVNGPRPDEPVVSRIWQTFRDIADEKRLDLGWLTREALYNAIGLASPNQRDFSEVALEIFRVQHLPEYSRTIDVLQEEIRKRDEYIKELEEENERLKKQRS